MTSKICATTVQFSIMVFSLWILLFPRFCSPERTRDIAVPVRKLAYQVLAQKVHIRSFSIEQRISLLRSGLKDPNNSVKDACEGALLKAWLRTFDGSALNLMCMLDVENAEEDAEKVLMNLFKGRMIID